MNRDLTNGSTPTGNNRGRFFPKLVAPAGQPWRYIHKQNDNKQLRNKCHIY